MKKIFKKAELDKLWSSGRSISLGGKTYRVGKMSYGSYFLEPKKDWKRSEMLPHSNDTLWFDEDTKINQYGVKQKVFIIEQNRKKLREVV